MRVIQRIPILPFSASLVVCVLMWSPRSYGGDFWLHLWLINQQAESWRDSLLPSTLISFSPVGTLNTLPMFSGGLTYAIAGALVASGLSINGSVVLIVAALYGVTIWESQLTARSYGLSGLSVTAVSLVPAAFAWPIGDGFGRGGFSSFCAGMLSIALLLRTVRSFGNPKHSLTSSEALILVIYSALAFTTHLPTTVLLVTIGFPCFSLYLLHKFGTLGFVRASLHVVGYVGAGIGIGAMYLLPAYDWSRYSTFYVRTGGVPFQATVSDYFVSPGNLWSLVRKVPSEHTQAWSSWVGIGFTSPTSLIVAQPTLIYVLMLAMVIVFSRKKIVFLLVAILVSLFVLIMTPDLWSKLPLFVQSVQYSFRALYIVIPFTVILAAEVITIQRRHVRAISLSFLAVVGIEVTRTVYQFTTTTNISFYSEEPNADAQWTYNVPQAQFLSNPDGAAFWYAADEQKSTDGIAEPGTFEPCSSRATETHSFRFPSESKWQLKTVTDGCLEIDLASPISWFHFVEAREVWRESATSKVFVGGLQSDKHPIALEVRMLSAPVVGLFISILSFVATLIWLSQRRRHSSQPLSK